MEERDAIYFTFEVFNDTSSDQPVKELTRCYNLSDLRRSENYKCGIVDFVIPANCVDLSCQHIGGQDSWNDHLWVGLLDLERDQHIMRSIKYEQPIRCINEIVALINSAYGQCIVELNKTSWFETGYALTFTFDIKTGTFTLTISSSLAGSSHIVTMSQELYAKFLGFDVTVLEKIGGVAFNVGNNYREIQGRRDITLQQDHAWASRVSDDVALEITGRLPIVTEYMSTVELRSDYCLETDQYPSGLLLSYPIGRNKEYAGENGVWTYSPARPHLIDMLTGGVVNPEISLKIKRVDGRRRDLILRPGEKITVKLGFYKK
jgi:hypothetical protein